MRVIKVSQQQSNRTRACRGYQRACRAARHLIVCLLSVCAVASANASNAVNTAYTHPQQLVDIGGGRSMNLYCIGSGSPTIILESGLSDWSFVWVLVQPQLSTLTKTCSYDRAGLGYSTASHRAGNSANMVDDLHQLLKAAQLKPPYLLVGHSLGGLNVRLYADKFFDEVSGMVLLDSSHEDGFRRIDALRDRQESRRYAGELVRAQRCVQRSAMKYVDDDFRAQCIEPPDPRYSNELNAAREHIARRSIFQRAQRAEIQHYADGSDFDAVRKARRSYGELPLLVLTAQKTVLTVGPVWTQLQQELAALSRRGVQRTINEAGHYLQLDRPEAVIAAVRCVLASAALQAPAPIEAEPECAAFAARPQ